MDVLGQKGVFTTNVQNNEFIIGKTETIERVVLEIAESIHFGNTIGLIVVTACEYAAGKHGNQNGASTVWEGAAEGKIESFLVLFAFIMSIGIGFLMLVYASKQKKVVNNVAVAPDGEMKFTLLSVNDHDPEKRSSGSGEASHTDEHTNHLDSTGTDPVKKKMNPSIVESRYSHHPLLLQIQLWLFHNISAIKFLGQHTKRCLFVTQ